MVVMLTVTVTTTILMMQTTYSVHTFFLIHSSTVMLSKCFAFGASHGRSSDISFTILSSSLSALFRARDSWIHLVGGEAVLV